MGTYVTPTGFKRKTLQEVRQELETALKRVFGPAFETAVDSPNGVLISQLALAQSNLWELALEVFVSRDPNEAAGVALDWIAELNGLSRKQATACKVQAMLYSSVESLLVPAGSIANRERGALPFSLDADVFIDRNICASLLILDDGSQKSTEYVFHFTFGDVSINNSTSSENLNVLQTAIIAAGGFATFPTGSVEGGLLVTHSSGDVGITGALPGDFEFLAMEPGNFTATEEGYQTCEIGELNQVVSPVNGWERVYNVVAGVPGSNVETDTELRVRRAAAARAIHARGTDASIAAHLREDVAGVTAASVVSNRTMLDDADGRPPKSFEALVVGGTDQAVAQNIWQNQPSGIQSYGNTSVEISDGEGVGQIVSFSRPQAKYLWVKIEWQRYSEETAPTNDEIKAALLQWAEKEYKMGVDVISMRILQGLYSGTTGIGNATANVAITDSPTDTPVWQGIVAQIPISPSNYAVLAASRITIIEDT